MSVPDCQHPSTVLTHPRDHPVAPLLHLVRLFAAGAAVGPQPPARIQLTDLRGRDALVVAVVPLGQVGVDAEVVETSQLRGVRGAATW